MFGSDQALGLGGGGVLELGGQRFPGQGVAGAEVSGVLEPAVGFVPRDPQPLGDDGGHRGRPQLDGGGFGVQAGQDLMGGGGDPPQCGLQGAEHGHQLGVGESVRRQVHDRVDRGGHGRDRCHHHVAIVDRAGTHTRTLFRTTDKKP